MGEKDDDTESMKVFIKMEFVFENRTDQATLRQVLMELGAQIKNGPPPCAKPTTKVKALLKALKNSR